jgi:hypothetical protein
MTPAMARKAAPGASTASRMTGSPRPGPPDAYVNPADAGFVGLDYGPARDAELFPGTWWHLVPTVVLSPQSSIHGRDYGRVGAIRRPARDGPSQRLSAGVLRVRPRSSRPIVRQEPNATLRQCECVHTPSGVRQQQVARLARCGSSTAPERLDPSFHKLVVSSLHPATGTRRPAGPARLAGCATAGRLHSGRTAVAKATCSCSAAGDPPAARPLREGEPRPSVPQAIRWRSPGGRL